MISFPNCKINIGLTVIGKRKDGYHDLETVFYPVHLNDVLEVISCSITELQTRRENEGYVKFSTSGITIDGKPEDNLCIKAYQLLKEDLPELPPVKMHLHKVIPMGAGLGGGSSDGAFTLMLLNEKFALHLTKEQLISYASKLGSDCPFFIINKPSFATSRGEMMERVPVDLSGRTLVLVNCGIHINTAWAFNKLGRLLTGDQHQSPGHLREVVLQPLSSWKDSMVNDFEQPVFDEYPDVKKIKDELYRRGAVYASMSGSGSTVFGIFNEKVVLDFPMEYRVMTVQIPPAPFLKGE